jgi:3',5'-cyclic AMP phosphodiesterase CpdA
MFTLAHLSDLHLAPLPTPRISELASKRVLGYLNWWRKRAAIHRAEVAEALVRDLKSQAPDHIAVTGDLVNIALDAEFSQARVWLDRLGFPADVTLVPGNHDAYVRAAIGAPAAHWREFMQEDSADAGALRFPFVRRRGPLALIGLTTAVPTAPFMATGQLGAEQIGHVGKILDETSDLFRVVLIHHPPVSRRGWSKRLIDAPALRAVLRERGAELVIHGHDHVHALEWLEGRERPIPVLGVPSASSSGYGGAEHAAYNLYRIDRASGAFTCELVSRGFRAGGPTIGELRRKELEPLSPTPGRAGTAFR